jgi:hypothetical protein
MRKFFDATPSDTRLIRVLGTVFLLLGILANPWLLAHIKSSRQIGIASVLLISLFDLFMLVVGSSFVLSKHKITVFRTVLIAVTFSSSLLAVLGGSEIYLAFKPSDVGGPYHAFRIEHLHPFYFFSLPSEKGELARINNAVVSVTPEGFRGPGPENKGTRKLAFVLGGSAVFGDGASSDQTTISGYLNGLQQEYYFVNAGVPSWNSTQEFYRISMQLLRYKPDLIVVYDGFNDVQLDYVNRHQDRPFPPGTPESYDQLALWVDDIRARSDPQLITFHLSRLYDLTFPRTRDAVNNALSKTTIAFNHGASIGRITPEEIAADSASYLWNISNMSHLATAYSTRLVVFWQPCFALHRTATIADKEKLDGSYAVNSEYFGRFHQYAVEHRDRDLQFHDLGDVFDQYSDKTALSAWFNDDVHLTDEGNRIAAGHIWNRISSPVAP